MRKHVAVVAAAAAAVAAVAAVAAAALARAVVPYTRFPSFFWSSALIFLAGLATPFCTDFISFTAMRFVMGLTYDSALSLYYLLGEGYYCVTPPVTRSTSVSSTTRRDF